MSDYYVSNNGNDYNSGNNIVNPWSTLGKVNNFAFQSGDIVHFERDSTFRGYLTLKNGVKYTSYGIGEKPKFYGSIPRDNESDWEEESKNIWVSTARKTQDDKELIKNGEFKFGLDYWSIHKESVADVIHELDEYEYFKNSPSLKLTSVNSGTSKSHIQIFTRNIEIELNNTYELSFYAKSTIPFVPEISIQKQTSPFNEYIKDEIVADEITEDWTLFKYYFTPTESALDGRFTMFLGDKLPNSSVLHLDNISIKKVYDEPIILDVGNVIFANDKVGIKCWNENDLDYQNKFWFDRDNKILKMYSYENPALLNQKLEIALNQNVIQAFYKSDIEIENLDIKYGGAHGIMCTNVDNVKIKNCDISYIGGAFLKFNGNDTRFGNGIEFWNQATNIIVDGCKIYEIYDAGITNQGRDNAYEQKNISYVNNYIYNCSGSLEMWGEKNDSTLENVTFQNNICENAGFGWGGEQRPDLWGQHLVFWSSGANAIDIKINNNIFYNSQRAVIEFTPNTTWNDIENISINNNIYSQIEDSTFARWNGNLVFNANEVDFNEYRNQTGNDINSILKGVI